MKPDTSHPLPRYEPKLTLRQTEEGIKLIKDYFEQGLSAVLNLQRVSAPRFLEQGNGLQDDLGGTQVPVSFLVPHSERPLEVVHSLAKWKRHALARYGFQPGSGLYTDMDAIRKDETVDAIHSTYVDQWDWERVILPEERNLAMLRRCVLGIYQTLVAAEAEVARVFSPLEPRLPSAIHFVHAQVLEDRYPDLSPSEREHRAAQELGALFLIGIGAPLTSGKPHDVRAADYDDWSSPNEEGHIGLNGDIIVWDPIHQAALELSSMGVRVDAAAMERQLRAHGLEDRRKLEFHKGVLEGQMPQTIGGGIGQSRMCMLLLHKAHIGEVQVGVWPPEIRRACAAAGITLL